VANRPRPLLIGAGAGIGRVLYWAEQMRGQVGAGAALAVGHAPSVRLQPLALLGSCIPFPFRPRPSVIVVPGIPTGIIACMPLLEEWGIASRLATPLDLPGCFEGTVTELADVWLNSLNSTDLADIEILSCGPTPLLDATAELARRYGVPHQTPVSDDVTHALIAPPAPRG
jgi:dihydroorotate dehydrogenase electron transfer subunit